MHDALFDIAVCKDYSDIKEQNKIENKNERQRNKITQISISLYANLNKDGRRGWPGWAAALTEKNDGRKCTKSWHIEEKNNYNLMYRFLKF